MSWTCSDEYLILDKFTSISFHFANKHHLNFAITLFSQLEKTSADYKDFNGVVGNETNESAVFRNFTFYFNQLDPLLSHGTLYSSHPLISLISGARVSNRLLSFKYTIRSHCSQCPNYLSPYRRNSTGNQLTLNNLWHRFSMSGGNWETCETCSLQWS